MDIDYIGHIQGNRVQKLTDHLNGVATLASSFGKSFGLGEEAGLIGKYHDIGKFQKEFRQYILGEYKGRVDHSIIGGKLFLNNHSDLGILGAFCIAGHHCGLQNLKLENGLLNRMQKSMPAFDECVKLAGGPLPSRSDLNNELEKYMDNSHKGMDLMLLTRMLYSCLVDADFLDTEKFMNPDVAARGNFLSMTELHKRFWTQLRCKGFLTPKNELNKKRLDILKTCQEQGRNASGLYSLTVPTGGGKTISSLAFALEQAVCHKKELFMSFPILP